MFEQLWDNEPDNRTYLSVANVSLPHAKPPNVAPFVHDALVVSPVRTGRLSADLTAQDDILIAVLSLLLLFAIEGLVSAVLLRARRGSLHAFSFSVRRAADLARDFRLRSLLPRRDSPRRLSPRLLAVAAAVVLLSLAAQVAVLLLTSPARRTVTNAEATFRLAGPFLPLWADVWAHAAAFVARPCAALTLVGVAPAATRISACLTSDLPPLPDAPFARAQGRITATLTSDLHAYGAEHRVQIGDDAANFSARAYFRLSDGRERVMPRAGLRFDRQRKMHDVHMQYIAFLFTAYARATGDEVMSLAQLENRTSFIFDEQEGPLVDIIAVNRRRIVIRRTSRRYVTTVRGVLPRGAAALQFARPVLKASIATMVAGPDDRDLIMASGSLGRADAVVWEEDFRHLNWLRLLIVLGSSFAVLTALRVALRPLGMAEIAGACVPDAAAARGDPGTPPLFPEDSKRDFWFSGRRQKRPQFDPEFPEPPEQVVTRGAGDQKSGWIETDWMAM